jgi:hypothetical protein
MEKKSPLAPEAGSRLGLRAVRSRQWRACGAGAEWPVELGASYKGWIARQRGQGITSRVTGPRDAVADGRISTFSKCWMKLSRKLKMAAPSLRVAANSPEHSASRN